MVEKPVKTRISVTVTEIYVSALDQLVQGGIYLSRGEVIQEALRRILGSYGIVPFTSVKPQTLEEPR